MEAYEPDIEKVLIDEATIQAKLVEMGARITEDYADKKILLVGVLKGAFVLMADLSRHIRLPLEFDFMAVSSYGSGTASSGNVRMIMDMSRDIKDRHVVLCEGVVDSGTSLKFILELIEARGAASIKVATLLDKVPCRKHPVPVDYAGWRIGSEFVVGYGMDVAERYRNLPYVGVLEEA